MASNDPAYAHAWYVANKAHVECYRKRYMTTDVYKEARSKDRLNKRLRLTHTYIRMKQRVGGKVYPLAVKIYAGLSLLPQEEFMSWATANKDFHRLFDAWVASGFIRRLSPSIDRIDPSIGYQISNMQWLTSSDNARRARKKEYSQKELAARAETKRIWNRDYMRRERAARLAA
jgi:hypothetical protein